MDFTVGQMVDAKCGRDAGRPFVIVGVEDDYLWLADGKRRTLDRPKRKKQKHVQATGICSESLREALLVGTPPQDAQLRRYLKECSGR